MDILSPKNFPYPITRACAALPYLPAFLELPDGFIRIVLRIVQKINVSKPFSAIFASRQTLSEESGKSLDTVHRTIKWLEDHGLIERERKAKIGYRGSKSPLQPTQTLLETLGIVDSSGSCLSEIKPRNKFIDAPGQESIGQDACAADQSIQKRGQFVRMSGVTIPIDLAWLCGKGVSVFGVLALMRNAKAVSQRLSDILCFSKKYIENLESREIFAYLSKLINSGRDFSRDSREADAANESKRISEYVARKAEELEGQTFVSGKTGAQFTVEEGVITEIRNGIRSVRLMTQNFIDAIHDGRLRSKKG